MAIFPNWKPKTVAGKIIKGAVIGGGSVLGLVTGLGAVGGIIKGTGAAAGAVKGLATTRTVLDKVGAAAVNLVTGTTKEQREILQEYKKEIKTEAEKLAFANKLIDLGMSQAEAREKAGLSPEETISGEKLMIPATQAGMNKFLMYGLLAVGALFIIGKLKRR